MNYKVQDQSVSQMNFGKDSTCRNPISPEAAPCLVMNELYGSDVTDLIREKNDESTLIQIQTLHVVWTTRCTGRE